MASIPIKDQIISQLDRLTEAQQQQLLEYAIGMQGKPPGIPGEGLITLAHQIDFPAEDLAEIVAAIEEDCERVDWDDWQ